MLAPAMAKQAALDAGVHGVRVVEDGKVTEGSSNNVYIVSAAGSLVTRRLGKEILHGVTRTAVLKVWQRAQIEMEERPGWASHAQA